MPIEAAETLNRFASLDDRPEVKPPSAVMPPLPELATANDPQAGRPVQVDEPAPPAPIDAAAAVLPPPDHPSPTTELRPSQVVPLPVPRPADLRRSDDSSARQGTDRRRTRRAKDAGGPAPVADEPSLLEKLFGIAPPSGVALSYASLGPSQLEPSAKARLSPTPYPDARAGTAIYDISAQVVILPNGERLEAHSGLGDKLDDPRYVHVRMRGATPPGIYDLKEREQLFHGVRALRLTPVGTSASVHQRDGLLAHTYMLGPKGDSNGCVSFRDYEGFLQAYLRGEVQRLVVVAGAGKNAMPAFAGTLPGARKQVVRADLDH